MGLEDGANPVPCAPGDSFATEFAIDSLDVGAGLKG
jgi:hypothetical protein